MRRIIRGFCRNRLIPYTIFRAFWFWLRIRRDIRIRKRLANSVSRGVADSPIRRAGELLTRRLGRFDVSLCNVTLQTSVKPLLLKGGEVKSVSRSDWMARRKTFFKRLLSLITFKNLASGQYIYTYCTTWAILAQMQLYNNKNNKLKT